MGTGKELLLALMNLYGDKAPEVECCRKLFKFILSKPLNQLQHLTFSRLMTVAATDDKTLLRVLVIISGAKYSILMQEYEFLDEDGEYLDATKSIAEFSSNGGFAHPRTGEIVESYRDNVFVYYKAIEGTFDLLKGALS